MTRRDKLTSAEYVFAWLLIVNAGIALIADGIAAFAFGIGPVLMAMRLPLVGLVAGVASLRGSVAGFIAAALFYLVQCVRYYSPDLNFGFTAGFQLGFFCHPWAGETLAINLVAIAGLVYALILINSIWSREESVAREDYLSL